MDNQQSNGVKHIVTATQLKKLLVILGLDKNIKKKEFMDNLDVIKFKISDSDSANVYVMISFKQFIPKIDPMWKVFRGTIVKNFEYIVADSHGHTPTVSITPDIVYGEKRKVYEKLDNGQIVPHLLNFERGNFEIRPAQNGLLVRVWKQDGIIVTSTLRKPFMNSSIWIEAEKDDKQTQTFKEKFDSLFGPVDRLFDDSDNSPYCHSFLMCTKEISSSSQIEVGDGFIIYIETIKCYEPIDESKNEEYESFALTEISPKDLTDEDIQNGIEINLDRYAKNLDISDTGRENNYLSRLIPPKNDGSLFQIAKSMTIQKANMYLKYGVSKENKETLSKYEKDMSVLGSGGSLFYVEKMPDGYDKTFILSPENVIYKNLLIGDPNNRLLQLYKLRDIVFKSSTEENNFNIPDVIDVSELTFSDICFPNEDDSYYALGNPIPEGEENFTFLKPYTGVRVIENVSQKIGKPEYYDEIWAIIAYFYCLAMNPERRQSVVTSFEKIQYLKDGTIKTILNNWNILGNEEYEIYTKKPLSYHNTKATSKRMREIISYSRNNMKYTENNEQYQKTVRKQIRNFLNKERSGTMYKIIRLVEKINTAMTAEQRQEEKTE